MSNYSIPISLSDGRLYRNIPSRYPRRVSLAKNISRFRKALKPKMLQEDLGEIFNIGQGGVSKWETGKSQPSATELPKLALALHCTVEDLLRGENEDYDATIIRAPTTPQPPHERPVVRAALRELREILNELDDEKRIRFVVKWARRVAKAGSQAIVLLEPAPHSDTRRIR